MPTILRYRGLSIMIFTNDHAPPHVHVIGANGQARFDLLCDLGQVSLKDHDGFSIKQLSAIGGFLNDHIEVLCQTWSQYHGF